MSVDNYARETGSDLELLARLIGAGASDTAVLPLHTTGPINVEYYILKDTRDACAAEFAKHAQTLQEIAEGHHTEFSLTNKIGITGKLHHRAVLSMPHDRVVFTVLWVEKLEVTEPEPKPAPVRHYDTYGAHYNRTYVRCDCGWERDVPSGLTALQELGAAWSAHVNEEMTPDA